MAVSIGMAARIMAWRLSWYLGAYGGSWPAAAHRGINRRSKVAAAT